MMDGDKCAREENRKDCPGKAPRNGSRYVPKCTVHTCRNLFQTLGCVCMYVERRRNRKAKVPIHQSGKLFPSQKSRKDGSDTIGVLRKAFVFG